MTEEFLPGGYKVPETPSNYMHPLKTGANRFRALASPVIGWKGWVKDPEKPGKDKAIHTKTQEEMPREAYEGRSGVQHFWAFPVFNYACDRIQILEITQKTILFPIETLINDPDWGSPLGYDIVVTKEGEKKETSYPSTQPKPKTELDPAIAELFSNMTVNMEALFSEDGNPFAEEDGPLTKATPFEGPPTSIAPVDLASSPQKARLWGAYSGLAKKKGHTPNKERYEAWVANQFNLGGYVDVSSDQVIELLARLTRETEEVLKEESIQEQAAKAYPGDMNENVNPSDIPF